MASLFMAILLYCVYCSNAELFVCRCSIPVVIMGETGCGKTRLIRYMCDLARQGQKVKNLLILKVRCLFNDGN